MRRTLVLMWWGISLLRHNYNGESPYFPNSIITTVISLLSMCNNYNVESHYFPHARNTVGNIIIFLAYSFSLFLMSYNCSRISPVFSYAKITLRILHTFHAMITVGICLLSMCNKCRWASPNFS